MIAKLCNNRLRLINAISGNRMKATGRDGTIGAEAVVHRPDCGSYGGKWVMTR
jgi:hypothetical protein